MERFLRGVLKINQWMQHVATVALTFMIVLTTVDVILRVFGKPVPGAVEIIAIAGGIVIGFTIPITSWMRGHISVDFVLGRMPERARAIVNILSRCAAIFLFLLISWKSVMIGTDFFRGSEVSGTLQIPLYPVAYALAACRLVRGDEAHRRHAGARV